METLIVLMLLVAAPALSQTVEYTQCAVRMELDNGQKMPVEENAVTVLDTGKEFVIHSNRYPYRNSASGPLVKSIMLEGYRIESSAQHPITGQIFAKTNKPIPGFKQSYAVLMDGGLMQVLCN